MSKVRCYLGWLLSTEFISAVTWSESALWFEFKVECLLPAGGLRPEEQLPIRTTADWTVPIIGWLDFKITVFETDNNQPPADTDRNSFTMTAGLSFRF